jgi:hypothetical protein
VPDVSREVGRKLGGGNAAETNFRLERQFFPGKSRARRPQTYPGRLRELQIANCTYPEGSPPPSPLRTQVEVGSSGTAVGRVLGSRSSTEATRGRALTKGSAGGNEPKGKPDGPLSRLELLRGLAEGCAGEVPGVLRRRGRKFGGSLTQAIRRAGRQRRAALFPRGITRGQPLERALGGSRCPPAAPFAVRRTVLSPSFPDRELGKAGCRRS